MGVLAAIFPSKLARGPIFREQKSQTLGLTDEQRKQNPDIFKDDAFFVQVALNEKYKMSAEVSDNPVEKGIDVTDNINVKPDEITLKMLQSDTPVTFGSLIGGIAASEAAKLGATVPGAGPITALAGGAAGSLAGLLRNPTKDSQGLSTTCLQHFEKLLKSKAIMTVQTGLKLFTNMAITGIEVERTPKDGKALNFSVTMRQIRVVESVIIKQIAEKKVNNKAQKKSDLGKQNSSVPNQSLLTQIKNKFSTNFKAALRS